VNLICPLFLVQFAFSIRTLPSPVFPLREQYINFASFFKKLSLTTKKKKKKGKDVASSCELKPKLQINVYNTTAYVHHANLKSTHYETRLMFHERKSAVGSGGKKEARFA